MGIGPKARATHFVMEKTAPPQRYVDLLTELIEEAEKERTEEIARFCEEMSGECGSKLAELIRQGHARG